MEILQPTLKRKNISWPDVYFAAEANREPFRDATIVTLKSYFVERLYDRAIAEVGMRSEKKLQACVHSLVIEGKFYVREHVKISPSGIRVVVNISTINDDTLWYAFDILSDALDQLGKNCGRVEYGDPICFLTTELPLLHKH